MNVTTRAFKCAGMRQPKPMEMRLVKAEIAAQFPVWHRRRFNCDPDDFSMEANIRRHEEEALQERGAR